MGIGAAEIKVNEADLFSSFRQQQGEVGGNHGLAGSAFT
jgi:hypothetical protein